MVPKSRPSEIEGPEEEEEGGGVEESFVEAPSNGTAPRATAVVVATIVKAGPATKTATREGPRVHQIGLMPKVRRSLAWCDAYNIRTRPHSIDTQKGRNEKDEGKGTRKRRINGAIIVHL